MPGAEDAQPGAQNAHAAAQQQERPRPVLHLKRVAARLDRDLAPPARGTPQQLLCLAEGILGTQVTEAVTRELLSPDWNEPAAAAPSFWGALLLLFFHAAPKGSSGPARLLRELWAVSVCTSTDERAMAPGQSAGSLQPAVAAAAAPTAAGAAVGLVLERCVLREFLGALLVLLRYEEVSGVLASQYGEPYAVLHRAMFDVSE